MHNADIKPLMRKFLPQTFVVSNWASLEPFFSNLINRNISSLQSLQQWLEDLSELEAVLSEDVCRRQIKMTCNTEDPTAAESFGFFMNEIQPCVQPCVDALNKKLLESPDTDALPPAQFATYLRNIKNNISLYHKANLPLQSQLAVEAQEFGAIAAKMMVTVKGKEYTLQQAARFLEDPDRDLREAVYKKIAERKLADKESLDTLFDSLLKKRVQIAVNAGFENYRDYRFAELGRFDYTKEDCFLFHDAVKQYILPVVNDIYKRKKEKAGIATLRPWDVDAEPAGTAPLKPFATGAELLQKSIFCFQKLDPFFGACLKKMQEMDRFDLESRKGKAPGGYNCPLAETGAPFIFMNAAGTLNDVITLMHEGGHAVHSFLAHPLPLTGFKEYPMEMAELASMGMELFSTDVWDVFFPDPQELQRARMQHLERVLTIFPWIAAIDKFQHWIYENPLHTPTQRVEIWRHIQDEFTPESLDTSGLDNYRKYSWQKQLHLYEVPFYYIEYGIAQLGAIGLWKQFKENKQAALKNYKAALRLGGTRTLPELYETAGLKFDFSAAHIRELMEFVQNEMAGIILQASKG